MEGFGNIDFNALIGDPDKREAQLAALRNQQMQGQILGGSSVGGGSVSNLGRQMMTNANSQMDKLGTGGLGDIKDVLQIQKMQKELTDPDYKFVPDATTGGYWVDPKTRSVEYVQAGTNTTPNGYDPMNVARLGEMPAEDRKLFLAARETLSGLPDLLTQLYENKEAFGYGSDIPSMVSMPAFMSEAISGAQKAAMTDSQRQARSSIFQQAYGIINRLAGSSVSEGEAQKIKQFAPSENDSAEVIASKLMGAINEAKRQQQRLGNLYGVQYEDIDVSNPFAPKQPKIGEAGSTPDNPIKLD